MVADDKNEKKDKYEMYCGDCSNLMKIKFLDRVVTCCGGNVDHPEKCSLARYANV